MNFVGVIIEESLQDKSILKKVKILKTEIENVTEEHQTPWLTQWTLHTVEIPDHQIETVVEMVRIALEKGHHSWYADFKNNFTHYIIFPKKIFRVNRKKVEEYENVTSYGISVGIPAYQVDFSSEII